MNIRILVLSVALVLPTAGYGSAAASEPKVTATLAENADAQAERITDVTQYLATLDQSLALARKGGYGPLKRGSEKKLKAARDTIGGLLKGHASASELPPDDRIALYNAEQVITSIIRNKDKDRMVCRREATLGSRLATTECLTVAEREARARSASDSTDSLMRTLCVPGATSSCAK